MIYTKLAPKTPVPRTPRTHPKAPWATKSQNLIKEAYAKLMPLVEFCGRSILKKMVLHPSPSLSTVLTWSCLAWCLVWSRLVWSAWSGLSGLVWPGLALSGLTWSVLLWPGLARSGLVWCGLVWPGLSWPGLVSFDLAWFC